LEISILVGRVCGVNPGFLVIDDSGPGVDIIGDNNHSHVGGGATYRVCCNGGDIAQYRVTL